MENQTRARPLELLIAEDNPNDVILLREALKQAKVVSRLHVATDGVEAIEFLRRQGSHGAAPRPDLILLDLNMPRKNGQEVLVEIKGDAELKTIPIIVLTTSRSDSDVLAAYGHHANCYITKPISFDAFAEVVRSIQKFWFTSVTLPPP